MISKPSTVARYLKELPAERRKVVSAVRSAILRHLPRGYKETMAWGMISYEVPLERYPDTYNGKPLCYAALAALKSGYSVYLMSAYTGTKAERLLKEGFRKAGKRLDMGKSCVRFRRIEDLPLDVIGRVVASTAPAAFVKQYEASRRR